MLPGQLYLSLSRVPAWRGGLEKIKEVLFPLQFTVLNPVLGFPGGSDGKESACNVGDLGSILGSGRSPRERNGYPLQYSCLQNSTDREAWSATVHGVIESDMTKRLTYIHTMLLLPSTAVTEWEKGFPLSIIFSVAVFLSFCLWIIEIIVTATIARQVVNRSDRLLLQSAHSVVTSSHNLYPN